MGSHLHQGNMRLSTQTRKAVGNSRAYYHVTLNPHPTTPNNKSMDDVVILGADEPSKESKSEDGEGHEDGEDGEGGKDNQHEEEDADEDTDPEDPILIAV
jgi:hypothetical protein